MEHGIIKYDAPTVATLKQTVAQGASDAELRMFIEHCKSTGLNPFKKEVWFIKAGGRVQIMTGINGFTQIANNHPQYDGMEVGLIAPDGSYVPLAYPKPDFIGAWARVHRKDRRVPTEAVAMLSEYDKGSGNWKSMRRVMIQKCAKSVALREAFPQELNGLYTSEEMPVEYSHAPEPEPQPVTVEQVKQAQAERAQEQPSDPQGTPVSHTVEYRIPYHSKEIDAPAWRAKLKASGFSWDKDGKKWIGGSVIFPELEHWRIGGDPVHAEEQPYEEDNVPEEFYDADYQESLGDLR